VSIDVTGGDAAGGRAGRSHGSRFADPVRILPVSQDEHTLCVDKVHFIGDPVAAVAATTEETATAALDLIKIVYEPLKSFDSAEAAVAHPEPQIHDYADRGNLHKLINLEFGDAEAGIADGDLVREDLFFFEGTPHLPMEQHAAVATWSPTASSRCGARRRRRIVHARVAKVLELAGRTHSRHRDGRTAAASAARAIRSSHEIAVAKLAMITGRR